MSTRIYSSFLALLLAAAAGAAPVPAKITVGSRTWDGFLTGRNDDLITFSQGEMAGGNVSYPASAIKDVEFPVEYDETQVNNMMQDRLYEELIVTLESALQPFSEYRDLPSNLARFEGVLMELHYKIGNYDRCLEYSERLIKDDRDPELQRKSLIFRGLSLLESGRTEEAQALFDEQGWNAEMQEDAPAEDLYITAKFMFMKKEFVKAAETVAKVIAFHSQDPDWMRPAEMLCAEIYLGMAEAKDDPDFLDSADEVIREITVLYKDTDEAEQAQKLKLKVDALRSEMGAETGVGDLFGR